LHTDCENRGTEIEDRGIQAPHAQPPSFFPPSSCEELTAIALSLTERVALGPQQRFRLVGVGVSNFLDPVDVSAQPALFGC